MLCHRCQFATQQAADFEEGDAEFRIGPHHPTLSSLKQSVEDKCYVCSLFGRRLNLEEANGDHSKLSLSFNESFNEH